MRRRLVWIQGRRQDALFFLYQGPDGYYVAKDTGPLEYVAPLSVGHMGFTAIGVNDWRFLARGGNDVDGYTVEFYGPTGLLTTIPVPLPLFPERATAPGSGVLAESFYSGSYNGEFINQRCWYTQSASGCIDTDVDRNFVLPGQQFPTDIVGGGAYQNADLTYAMQPGEVLALDGSITPITAGAPAIWPRYPSNNFTATMVGLTLYWYVWPGSTATNITIAPYRYDIATGGMTLDTSVVKQRNLPPSGHTLRYTSYWTATP